MANSKYDVTIDADNKGLTEAVNKSMEELNKLDSVADGLFGSFTGPMNGLKDKVGIIGSMSGPMKALGVAGLAAGAGISAISTAMEKVQELNHIEQTTGVSIEMLQRLQKEFKSTGMEIEKFGDINKDAMDHLGDSFREGGGGVADDLEKWGIELQSLTKYAGDAEGGIKAVVDVFYRMKQAGKSQAEIVNAMESMASDASHLVTTLEQYGSAQEALNHIQSQNADITSQTADEYKKFDDNMKKLSVNIDTLTVNTMSPLVEEINNLWDWLDKDWENTCFFKGLKKLNEAGVSPSGMSSGQTQNMSKNWDTSYEAQQKEWAKKYEDWDKKSAKQGEVAMAKMKKQMEGQAAAQQAINDRKAEQAKKDADKAKSAADKAQREREQAAAKAKATYDKMMADRASALQTLTQLDIAIIGQEGRAVASQMNQMQTIINNINKLRGKGIISSEQANERRNALMSNSMQEFKDMLTFNPDEIGKISEAINQMHTQQLEQLQASLDQGLIKQSEYNEKRLSLEQDYQDRLQTIKDANASQVNIKNLDALGYATDEQMMQLEQQKLTDQIEKFQEQNQTMYDQGLISHEEYLKQKEILDTAYANKSKDISLMETKTRLGMYEDYASGMAGLIAGVAGENSKAAQAAFAVSKGLAIATGMLNASESATAAMAKYPGPMGYAMAAASYASVIGEVMNMKSMSLSGMAHDGIDNVPTEGTWLLDGGERVVDQRTNEDLKSFLNDEKKGSGQVIDASVNINGNVTDQRWFMEQLKKQQQTITAIVKDGNRRKM